MGTVLAQLPEKIRKHLEGILPSTDLEQNEQSLEILAENWIAKKEMFISMIKSLSMRETEILEATDGRGALLLTFSGSLVGLGPERQSASSDEATGRWLEYASISLRSNVPAIVTEPNSGIKDRIAINGTAGFTRGKIKSTSALYKIAVCAPDVELAEQEKRIKEAMIFLTNAFVLLNRKSFSAPGETPDQFNLNSMVKFIAHKNNITQKQTRAVVTDLLALIETGILLKERVAFGRIGSLTLKLRPPRKPRVMKNRFTGGEITIPAMPERYAPKFKFSKRLKERAAAINPQ